MSNRAAAIRAAVQAQHPGAVVVERGRRHLVHDIGSGRRVLSASVGPLHYQQGNDWQEIDTAWVDSGDNTFPHANRGRGKIEASDGLRRRITPRAEFPNETLTLEAVEIRVGNRWNTISFLPGQRGRNDNLLVWENNDVRVEFASGGDRIKDSLVLKRAVNASSARWRYSLSGLRWQGMQLVSQTDDAVVAEMPQPWLEDAAGIHRDIQTTIDNRYITFSPDFSGLTYPVLIDPTITVDVGASADDGYWVTPGFSSGATTSVFGNIGGSSYNAFYRFTGLGAVSGTTINAAELRFVADSSLSTTTVNLTISAQASNNATAPTSAADASGRTITTATVAWNNVAGWTTLTTYTTPSLVSVVQELADSYLAAGVALFFVKNNGSSTNARRSAATMENGSPYQPELYIEYTVGGGGQSISLPHASASATAHALDTTKTTDLGRATASATAHALGVTSAVSLAHATVSATAAALDTYKTIDLPAASATATAHDLTTSAALHVDLPHASASATAYTLDTQKTVDLPHAAVTATAHALDTAFAIALGHASASATAYQTTVQKALDLPLATASAVAYRIRVLGPITPRNALRLAVVSDALTLAHDSDILTLAHESDALRLAYDSDALRLSVTPDTLRLVPVE